jgi:hypothetical protein
MMPREGALPQWAVTAPPAPGAFAPSTWPCILAGTRHAVRFGAYHMTLSRFAADSLPI